MPVFVVRNGDNADLFAWHAGDPSLRRRTQTFPRAFSGAFGKDDTSYFTWLSPDLASLVASASAPRGWRARTRRGSSPATAFAGMRPGSRASAGSSGRPMAAGSRSPAGTTNGSSSSGGPAGRPQPRSTSRPAARRARRRRRRPRTARARQRDHPGGLLGRPTTGSSARATTRRPARSCPRSASGSPTRPSNPSRRSRPTAPTRPTRPRRGSSTSATGRTVAFGANGSIPGGPPQLAIHERDGCVRVRRPLRGRDRTGAGSATAGCSSSAPTGRRSRRAGRSRWSTADGKAQTLVDAPRASVGALLGAKDGYAGLLLTATDPIRSQIVLVRLADGATSAVTVDSIGADGPIGFGWAP